MAGYDDLVTYLRLAPEFGDTRFGPFEGLEMRLGSNKERCHIVLAESLGVLPEHCKLLRQRDNSLILTPAERTATVFLWKPGERRPTQINTPTAVRPGDAFSLVTMDGPRFIIELDALPAEVIAKREAERRPATHRRRLTAGTMAAEGKRQIWSTALTYGPAQIAQRAWVFIKSGAIYQPRNVFLAFAILGGYIFGGWAMCSRKKYKTETTRITNESSACRQELEIAKSLQGESAEYPFPELAAAVTGSTKLGAALDSDETLRNAVKQETKIIFDYPKPYEWIWKAKSRRAADFAAWRERVEKEKAIDPEAAKLLVWLGGPAEGPDSDFFDLEDSQRAMVCGRGPLRLSYRQARNLGLNASPDALILKDAQNVGADKAKREALLLATMQGWDANAVLPEGTLETDLDPIRQGGETCVFLQGDDDRKTTGPIVSALAKVAGTEGANLPPDSAPFGPTARLAKVWSADLPNFDLTQKTGGFDLSPTFTGTILSQQGSGGAWVLAQTAKTIARAIAVPCLASLNGDAKEIGKTLGDGKAPGAINCLVLDYKLRHESKK